MKSSTYITDNKVLELCQLTLVSGMFAHFYFTQLTRLKKLILSGGGFWKPIYTSLQPMQGVQNKQCKSVPDTPAPTTETSRQFSSFTCQSAA